MVLKHFVMWRTVLYTYSRWNDNYNIIQKIENDEHQVITAAQEKQDFYFENQCQAANRLSTGGLRKHVTHRNKSNQRKTFSVTITKHELWLQADEERQIAVSLPFQNLFLQTSDVED